ncbi:T9SS type B sorting domain-containing protein [Winogradskyella pulchriflava]|uniref:T9SS type B sorting domain-containing protein n=1 Tax=Winogradskyella pulchriflava TaxID=1110688 RepID=A0ABV6Q854_9FLAO
MKKHFSLLTFYFILSCSITFSQNNTDCWTLIHNGIDIYNGQYNDSEYPGYHDPETTDLEEVSGGFLTTGQYNKQSFDSNDNNIYTNLEDKDGSYLTKHDYDGNLQWIVYTEKNTNSYRDVMFGSVEDNEGNIYVIGHSINGTFFDTEGTEIVFNNSNDSVFGGFIIKLDEDGKILWHIIIDNVYSKRINIDEEGNILLSGDVNIYNNNTFDFYLNGVITDNLSNFEIMGNNFNYVNRGVLKINPQGELLWYTGIKTDGPNSEFLIDIGSDNNNNVYVTGYCSFDAEIYSSGETDNPDIISWTGNSSKTFLIKFNQDGQLQWKVKSFLNDPVNNGGVLAWSTIVDEQGNSYITGSNDCRNNNNPDQIFENTDGTITSENVGTFFIAKVNTNGICEWIKGAAHSYSGTGYKVIKSNDEIIVVGKVQAFQFLPEEVEFLSSDGNNIEALFYSDDYFLAIYDADGNLNRVVSSGINEQHHFVGDRISGFFKDSNDNYYISRNIWFYNNGPQNYENFGHFLNAQSFNGRDGTITKFNEECGVVLGDIINQNMPNLSLCDNASVGTDTDGLVNFDLTQNEDEILINEPLSNYQISYYKDEALTNLILNPEVYENTFQSEIIYIKAEHLFDSDKSGETFFEIEVYALPITNSLVTLSQCDDNLDGFTTFNITEANVQLSLNYLDETITFYESQQDAETDTDAITQPTQYVNEVIDTDTVWARVENEYGCFVTSQVNLNVTSTQIPDTYFREFYECDASMDIHDGISVFDFSIVNSEIEAMFPNGQNLNISYHESLLDAYGNLNPIQDIANYTNTTPIAQDIYVRVVNSLNSECLGVGHYITLHVVEMPLITGPLFIEECDYDNDGLVEFSTSNFEYLLSDLQTIDVSFRYYDVEGNELPNPLPDPYITSEPMTNIIVSIIAENQNIPSGGCEVTTTITLFINSDYDIGEVPDYFGCLDTSDGYFTFDTSNLESSILNGQSDLEISYHDENSNLIESPFPNEYSLSESATIRAIVTNTLDPMLCPLEIDINFEVALKPEDIQIDDVYLCFEEGEEQIFYLREYLDASLDENNITNSEINAYNNGVLYDDIINVDFQNLNQAEINYRIENVNFPECYSVGSFNIISSTRPVVGDLSDIILCDDESNDGFENVDLQSISEEILNELSTSQYIISYFESYDNALENINPLQEEVIGSTDDQTIYVRVSSQENIDCYDISDFNFVVKPVPDISEIQNEYYLCKGESLIVSAGDGLDYYFWSNGITTSSITITEAGDYSITVLRDYPEISCEVSKTFVVYESEVPDSVEIVVIDESIISSDIQIIASGIGDYEYSLDGITYQDSNIFYDLNQSDYTIYVRDRNGCGVYIKELFLIRYPKFFTPNNDTENDYWQLDNANKELLNKLYIFDRYGKLLLELDPESVGWDGTYNGLQMPSSDYWFVLERQNGKTYTGHFALIR